MEHFMMDEVQPSSISEPLGGTGMVVDGTGYTRQCGSRTGWTQTWYGGQGRDVGLLGTIQSKVLPSYLPHRVLLDLKLWEPLLQTFFFLLRNCIRICDCPSASVDYFL